MRRVVEIVSFLLVTAALGACGSNRPGPVDQRNSALTQGNVQLNLRVGQTTKKDVLDTFGAPNITTRDASGDEVWSYQRFARVSQSTESGNIWNILIFRGGSATSGFAENTRTMTLIIYFNEDDIVSDFRSRASDF